MLSISFSEEFCAGNVCAGVKGRLKSSVSFWAFTLDAPQFTLDTISQGYLISFASYPAPCFLSNNLSALRHPDFVVHAISELLGNGCITEHSEPPFCFNPLTIAEGKKLPLVIDLRHVNCPLVPFKFKYKDLRSLSQVLQDGHWFFTWDLKSGYHHVDISPDLGFAWPFNGVLRYFTFAVLPFGLSSACFCFSKSLCPLVKRWRSMGHNSFVYLDDGFGSQPERTSALAAAFIQRKDLASSGLLVNEEKSHWVPMQVGDWLGFVINTISMTFQIPEKKACKLKRLFNSVIQNKSSSYRELARIAGSIISVALAVRPISRLLTRQMYLAIESRSAWDHSFLFPPALLEELKLWFCNIESFNGYSIRPPPPAPLIHPLLYFPTRATQLSEGFPPP